MNVVYIINNWAMDVTSQRLNNQQTKVVRTPGDHVYRLLQVFAQRPGETLPAYFLIQNVWQSKPVGINSLRVAISKLRVVIDDTQKPPAIIETVPGKGYQLNPDYLEILPDLRAEPEAPASADTPPSAAHVPEIKEGNANPDDVSRQILAWLVLIPLLAVLAFLVIN
ncbi:hypothetical protein KX75_20025 [Salmonella enterica subsp. enterica]|nr:hypothetical protein [Salmonella enterica subsp. enterica serovar Mikawasima]